VDHDSLMAMTDEEREKWLKDEIEGVISSAQPSKVLGLRRLQARIDGIKRKHKDPIARCNALHAEMIASLNQLNDALKGFRR
jgi:hypothetical protein